MTLTSSLRSTNLHYLFGNTSGRARALCRTVRIQIVLSGRVLWINYITSLCLSITISEMVIIIFCLRDLLWGIK